MNFGVQQRTHIRKPELSESEDNAEKSCKIHLLSLDTE